MNENVFTASEFIEFERTGERIEIDDNSVDAVDFFRCEKNIERMGAESSFVMHTRVEITQA
jgi:hypothetical protein